MDYGQFVDIEAYEFPGLVEGYRDEQKYTNYWHLTGNQQLRNEDEGFIVVMKMIVRLCKMFGM